MNTFFESRRAMSDRILRRWRRLRIYLVFNHMKQPRIVFQLSRQLWRVYLRICQSLCPILSCLKKHLMPHRWYSALHFYKKSSTIHMLKKQIETYVESPQILMLLIFCTGNPFTGLSVTWLCYHLWVVDSIWTWVRFQERKRLPDIGLWLDFHWTFLPWRIRILVYVLKDSARPSNQKRKSSVASSLPLSVV